MPIPNKALYLPLPMQVSKYNYFSVAWRQIHRLTRALPGLLFFTLHWWAFTSYQSRIGKDPTVRPFAPVYAPDNKGDSH
ncbi:cobaltochelatase, CobN subunit [Pseudomonas sp. StFLB209]|nr:cobaltochelatase, CobN subunit [Pseudomonas sp. StFLB209]